jgi:hypothetical protein
MPDTILAHMGDSHAKTGMSGIVAKLRELIGIVIPIGYQDETGFHTGVKPAEKEVKCPPVMAENKQDSISSRREFENLRE